MKTRIKVSQGLLTIAFFLAGFFCNAQNQSEIKKYHIETTDGNNYIGQVITSDSTKVVLKTDKLGEITILYKDIRKRTVLDASQVKGDKIWLENPQSTHYFFSPNGYGLRKGEGYYQNIWVLMNSFSVGLNDHLSLGAGVIPTFLFGANTPVWITAKASFPVVKEKFNLGAGILAGTTAGTQNSGFGIVYGIATVGSRDCNASVGFGSGFSSDSPSGSRMIIISGMCRVSQRGYLLTENYIFAGDNSTTVLLSLGGRTLFREAGLDYGLIIPVTDNSELIAIPWLGITIPFGNRK